MTIPFTDGFDEAAYRSEHPELKQWRRETNLGVLFAAGVLGYGE